MKGARELPPRGLAIMRELWDLRERLARAADRPPFKVLGEDVLLRVAQNAPTDSATLGTLGGIEDGHGSGEGGATKGRRLCQLRQSTVEFVTADSQTEMAAGLLFRFSLFI